MIATIVVILFVVIAITIWLLFNPRSKIYSVARLRTTDKIIAITFDDGPTPEATSRVLKILSDHNVHATFFVVGKNVLRYPEILSKIVSKGHLVANHSQDHDYSMFGLSSGVVKKADSTNKEIEKIIKKRPHFYRPPFGLRTPWGAKALKLAGYFVVTWDNMTFDYWGLSSDRIVNRIISKSRPGTIIVLHDGKEGLATQGYSNMLEALPVIITKLKQESYSFVTLDKLFDIDGYR